MKLEEIEKLSVPSGNPTSKHFTEEHKQLLINRVKELTECLVSTAFQLDKNSGYKFEIVEEIERVLKQE